jgi:hypothetical protein
MTFFGPVITEVTQYKLLAFDTAFIKIYGNYLRMDVKLISMVLRKSF